MVGLEDAVWIRDFRKPDLASALKVVQLSFEEFDLKGLDPKHIEKLASQMFGVLSCILRGLLKIFGKDYFRLFVAEVGGKIVGTVMIIEQEKVAYISTVAVHPDFRRRGIARRLVKSALEYIQNQKLRRAVLHVIPTNSPAKTLYMRFGFREFEKLVLFAADVKRVSLPAYVEGIEMADFCKSQTDTVYELLRCSEDPERLDVLDYGKDNLKTTFFERVFHPYSKVQMVASRDSQIVGTLKGLTQHLRKLDKLAVFKYTQN
jgi:ribosomal protein S18 acetylase RimI-like enzyme